MNDASSVQVGGGVTTLLLPWKWARCSRWILVSKLGAQFIDFDSGGTKCQQLVLRGSRTCCVISSGTFTVEAPGVWCSFVGFLSKLRGWVLDPVGITGVRVCAPGDLKSLVYESILPTMPSLPCPK